MHVRYRQRGREREGREKEGRDKRVRQGRRWDELCVCERERLSGDMHRKRSVHNISQERVEKPIS